MNKKRMIALVFVFFSVIISFTNLTVNGAVIGSAGINLVSLISVSFILIAVFFFLESRDLEFIAEEGIVLPSVAAIRIEERHPGKKSIVLDTSYVAAYTEKGANALMNDLRKYGEVIAPDSVLDELSSEKFRHLKPVVERYAGGPLEGFEIFRKSARGYLDRTEKAEMYKLLFPILSDIISGERKIESLTEQELKMINEKTTRLQVLAERDKFNMMGRGLEGIYRTRDYLKKHCKVSAADVDVVATAIAEAEYNNVPVVIAGKDIDFEQAVAAMKAEPIGSKISYETPYENK